MLALTRKKNEAIVIDGNIEIKVIDIQGDKVKIGIAAPKNITVHRQEIYVQIKHTNQEASNLQLQQINQLQHLMKGMHREE